MGSVKLASFAGMATVLSAGAYAADMREYPPIVLPPVPQVEEIGTGWYLRGDIGMSNQRIKGLKNVSIGPDVEFLDKGGFDSGVTYGVGLGYQFNHWLRFDVTGEYRGKTRFTALDRAPNPASPTGFQTNEYSASKSEWVGLVNAYVDLGTWYNVTPFVGAGIGYAYNTIDHYRDNAAQVGGVAYADRASKGNLAWAAHAGLAYRVNANLSLELSYRYLHLGDGISGDTITYLGGNALNNPTTFKDITSHDVRFGARWMLNPEPAPVPFAPPPPLMRRG